MVGVCSAINCSNTLKKGFRIHRFPSDKARFQLWAKQCGRDLDASKSNHGLCEIHFESNQYELRRADGRKLLRWNAVPTIFNYPVPLVPSKTKRIKNFSNLDNAPCVKKRSKIIPEEVVSCELKGTENCVPYTLHRISPESLSYELNLLRENISCDFKKDKDTISFEIENIPCVSYDVAVGECGLEECKQGCSHKNIIDDYKARISELESKLTSMQEELKATKAQLQTNKQIKTS